VRAIRLTNEEVCGDIDSVLVRIREALVAGLRLRLGPLVPRPLSRTGEGSACAEAACALSDLEFPGASDDICARRVPARLSDFMPCC
jgi:hypothetical protein